MGSPKLSSHTVFKKFGETIAGLKLPKATKVIKL
jgi:hypothetical protein